MKLPVEPGEKYAVIALDAAAEFRQVVDLGAGTYALPHATFELPEHWKKWLGSIQTDAIGRAGLLLLTTMPSRAPGVLDGENQALQRDVGFLYWGLLASGRVRVEGSGTRVTGAHADGELGVRQVADLDGVQQTRGMLTERVTVEHLRRAAALAANLKDLFTERRMLRMRLAVNTFLLAFSESGLPGRIHQFVRSVDGLTRVTRRGRTRFKERCELFVGAEQAEVCYELYVIRSNVEHFQDPSADLPALDPRADVVRGYRRAHEAEALARYCMARLVEDKHLWDHFADDHIDGFWAKPADERARIWGAPLDLAASVAAFNPVYVPTEER